MSLKNMGPGAKLKHFFKGFFFCIYSIINGNVLSTQISDFFLNLLLQTLKKDAILLKVGN